MDSDLDEEYNIDSDEYSDGNDEYESEHGEYSSESDDESDENIENSLYVAKNGMVWSPNPRQSTHHSRAENILTTKPGITRFASSRISTIKSSFDLFMTKSICENIVKHTNTYGKNKINGWLEIDLDTLNAYFAVL